METGDNSYACQSDLREISQKNMKKMSLRESLKCKKVKCIAVGGLLLLLRCSYIMSMIMMHNFPNLVSRSIQSLFPSICYKGLYFIAENMWSLLSSHNHPIKRLIDITRRLQNKRLLRPTIQSLLPRHPDHFGQKINSGKSSFESTYSIPINERIFK